MGSEETKKDVDVLIVGAGPAGLMMATWMSQCGINARIVDKRGTKVIIQTRLNWANANKA
jgi:phenol 2-monooxygenase (NADPH)